MKLRQLTDHLETIAPLELQEAYDNAGLLTGDPDQDITGVLCSLDATEEIVEEAIQKGCNVIVAHHPILFRGLQQITGADYIQRTLIRAIRAHIAIYAIHTNLDNVLQHGVNQRIAQRLELQDVSILAGRSGEPDIGAGVIGTLDRDYTEAQWLSYLRDRMQTACIKYTRSIDRPIRRVALCGGSGRFLLEAAQAAGADSYVTADIKYHEYFDADGKILLCDIGHYESEQFTIDLLQERIQDFSRTFAAHSTERVTNPVRYYH